MAVPQKRNDLAILLLGQYPKELKTGTETGICTPMFVAALFTVTESWKHPTRGLLGDWINKMCCTPVMHVVSLKKEGISVACYLEERGGHAE